MNLHYDLFVLGAGSGGVAAARASAALGARVGIAEADRMGGTCVNRGCVPKKFYVYAAQYAAELRNAASFGWTYRKADFDWARLKENVFTEIDRLNGVYQTLLRRFGVTIHKGRAEFIDPRTVQIGEQRITAERFLIATGGHPFVPDIDGATLGITSDEAFHLPQLPRRIAIVGGGYIACEFASIFNGLGVKTSLLIRGLDLLRGFDDDLRCHLHQELQQQGVHVHCNTNIVKVSKTGAGLRLHCDQCEDHETNVLMFATGRRPNSAEIGLERIGVERNEHGAIMVDELQQTGTPGIFAVGDVTDRLNLTPVAIHQGRAFAETQFGERQRKLDYRNIPTAIFSSPPVATVGLTETEARERYPKIDIFRSLFRPMKYALGDRTEKTLMKLVVDAASDRVLGVHMVGADAAEIIQGFAVALQSGATKADFDRTVGIHPSSAEEFVTMREKAAPEAGMKI
jgi:glutathione reductase (NADPH)